MIQIPTWAADLAIAALAAVIGIFAYATGRRKDRDAQVTERAVLNTKMDYMIKQQAATDKNVNDGMTRIESQFCGVSDKFENHETRITRVEESAKSAHHRIDELK